MTTVNVTEMLPPDDIETEVTGFGSEREQPPAEEVVEPVVEPTAEEETEEDLDDDEPSEPTDDEPQIKNPFDKQKLKWKAKIEAKDRLIEQLIRNQQQAPVQQSQPAVQQVSNEPTLEQFGGQIEAFTRAHSQWAVQSALQQQKHQTELAAYQARDAKFKADTPDYDEVTLSIANHPVALNASREVMDVIRESEVGPQIRYHFAKNISELARIDALPPYKRLIELGKLEAKLETKTAPAPAAPKKLSNAPAAAKPTTGGAPKIAKDLYSMSADEVADYLEAEERKNPRLRRGR